MDFTEIVVCFSEHSLRSQSVAQVRLLKVAKIGKGRY